jgi:hypothetical protein
MSGSVDGSLADRLTSAKHSLGSIRTLKSTANSHACVYHHCSLPLPNPCASSSACSAGDARTMRHPFCRAAESRICTRPLFLRLRWTSHSMWNVSSLELPFGRLAGRPQRDRHRWPAMIPLMPSRSAAITPSPSPRTPPACPRFAPTSSAALAGARRLHMAASGAPAITETGRIRRWRSAGGLFQFSLWSSQAPR